jgi:hypothetical protein
MTLPTIVLADREEPEDVADRATLNVIASMDR